jgi:RNase P subunit RPR2
MRPHDCKRCGTTLDPPPDSTYAVVDVLDAEGDLSVLLCRECGEELRRFLAGEE